MSIRVLIIDDEALARRRLRRLLGQQADVAVVGEAADGEEGLERVLGLRPDLIFLDIRMPGRDGMSLLRTLRARLPEGLRPLTVLTTAHAEYAVEAFELEGLDYLVKPIEGAGVERALRRARKELWSRQPPRAPAPAGEPAPTPTTPLAEGPRMVMVYQGDRLLPLALDAIACVLVEGGLCVAQTVDGPRRLKGSLQEVESRLPSPPFFRVSRSALVHRAWLKHLRAGESGTYRAVLKAPLDLEVPVSRRRARSLKEALGPEA